MYPTQVHVEQARVDLTAVVLYAHIRSDVDSKENAICGSSPTEGRLADRIARLLPH